VIRHLAARTEVYCLKYIKSIVVADVGGWRSRTPCSAYGGLDGAKGPLAGQSVTTARAGPFGRMTVINHVPIDAR
jgi:hypothetical protein